MFHQEVNFKENPGGFLSILGWSHLDRLVHTTTSSRAPNPTGG